MWLLGELNSTPMSFRFLPYLRRDALSLWDSIHFYAVRRVTWFWYPISEMIWSKGKSGQVSATVASHISFLQGWQWSQGRNAGGSAQCFKLDCVQSWCGVMGSPEDFLVLLGPLCVGEMVPNLGVGSWGSHLSLLYSCFPSILNFLNYRTGHGISCW